MLSALNSLKGSTTGMDRISYSMIKNSPPSFKIRILNHLNNILNLSNTFPLDDGIPQVSAISVILFLISYNSLTKIIGLSRQIKFTAYADDFNLIIEHNKRKTPLQTSLLSSRK